MNVPHIPPEEMKVKCLRFRVTEEEHVKFMEQAKTKGYKTFSDYIRALLNEDKKPSNKDEEIGFLPIGGVKNA